MDSDVKKQRRRSVRNLRKSACFVPPAVSYGSAWIGDNQETNICNLVTSLEELNCQDNLDDDQKSLNKSNYSQPHRLLQCDGDEACDGFPSDHPAVEKGAVPCSYRELQQSPKKRDVLLENKHSKGSLVSPVKSIPYPTTLPHQLSSERNVTGDEMSVEGRSSLDDLQLFPNHKCNGQLIRASINFEEQIHSVSEASYQTHSIESENCVQRESWHETEQYATRDTYDSSCALVNENEHNGDDLDENYSSETLDKCINESNTRNECSNTSHKSLDNSMSPEFTDFCPKSTESTPSTDPMNQAIRSFFDASSGSFLNNMSFSPMDFRPDTPKISLSSGQSTNSKTQYEKEDNILRKSISDIISSLDDPIISSDPTILAAISDVNGESDISSCISNKSIPMSPPSPVVVASTITNDLDRTYTLDESSATDNVEHSGTRFPDQTESQGININSPSLQPTVDDELEKMIVLDFDFVKSKRSERRTSNLFTPGEDFLSFSSVSREESSIGSDDDKVCKIPGDTTWDDQSFKNEKFDTIPVELENDHKMDIKASDSSLADIKSFNNDDDILVGNEKTTNDLHINSSSNSSLTDCGNVIESHEKVKNKKQRRKSNKLALLLEESVRFVVQSSSNHQSQADFPSGNGSDKENDVDENVMDFQESQTSDQSWKRNVRTRGGRKSWDFRKESQQSSVVEPAVVQNLEITYSGDSENYTPAELDDLQTIYCKQKYVERSPQPLETIKEVSNEKNIFLKMKVKRYLNFGSVSQAKEKKRTKKALSVYNGRQCYFPITEQEFDRKMLDVQIVLDSDLDFFCLTLTE